MPHFSPSGHDLVLCQQCGRDIDTGKEDPTWVKGTGNVCKRCLHRPPSEMPDFTPAPKPEPAHLNLRDHCRIESGGLTGAALDRYISRYYGHN